MLAGLPEGRVYACGRSLICWRELGFELSATEGWSAADVGATFRRAQTLARNSTGPDHLVSVMIGQWGFHGVPCRTSAGAAACRATRANRQNAERCCDYTDGTARARADASKPRGDLVAARAVFRAASEPC